MSVERAETPLRAVFDMLLQDMALEPVDPATLPWDEPIFVLRGAPIDHMESFFRLVAAHCAAPALHVMSHGRDEDALRALAPCDFTFHAYPTPGRYRLEDVPAAMLDRLRMAGLGTLFFLDTGVSAELFDEVERLFAAIAEHRMVTVRNDGTCARTADWRRRRRAHAAFLRLVEWYQSALDPGTAISENQDAPNGSRVTNERS
jgi:hypothetical protein